mmetsp:Transcript_17451/g.43513  ORF Transcript_17451/g.43513 Transcript_17451/m.43513 type:complete len:232 (-) Transcript_17451:339-1034(-)
MNSNVINDMPNSGAMIIHRGPAPFIKADIPSSCLIFVKASTMPLYSTPASSALICSLVLMTSAGVDEAPASTPAIVPARSTRAMEVSPCSSASFSLLIANEVKKTTEKGTSRRRVAAVPLYIPFSPSSCTTARSGLGFWDCCASTCILIFTSSIGLVQMTWQKPAVAPLTACDTKEMFPLLSVSIFLMPSLIDSFKAFSGNTPMRLGAMPLYNVRMPCVRATVVKVWIIPR